MNRQNTDLILEHTDENCDAHIFICEFRNVINNLKLITLFNNSPRALIKQAFLDHSKNCTHETMRKILEECINKCNNPFFNPIFEVDRLNRVFDSMEWKLGEILKKTG